MPDEGKAPVDGAGLLGCCGCGALNWSGAGGVNVLPFHLSASRRPRGARRNKAAELVKVAEDGRGGRVKVTMPISRM
jgi:hypothetical protein